MVVRPIFPGENKYGGGSVTKKEAIERIENQISEIDSVLSELPEGRLICARNGKYYKWFVNCKRKQAYIPKECKELAEQLAYKRYLEDLRLDLKDELRNLQFQIKIEGRKYRHIELLKKDGFYELLQKQIGLSDELKAWQEESYVKNPYYENELKIKVHDDLFVRSKSEAMIAMMLIQYKIPFRYECEMHVSNKSIYPDFTILHPKTKKIVYWEHFGMTDNYKYCRDNYNKLMDYFSQDVWLGDNLILTSETRNRPLDYETIENRIKEFFL